MEPDTSTDTDETTEAPTETDAWLDACPPGETRSVTIGDITYTRTVERHDANESDIGKTLREIAYYAPPPSDCQASEAYYETVRAVLDSGENAAAAPLADAEFDKAAEARLTEVLESFVVRWNKAMDA